jgi:hypothetical protein
MFHVCKLSVPHPASRITFLYPHTHETMDTKLAIGMIALLLAVAAQATSPGVFLCKVVEKADKITLCVNDKFIFVLVTHNGVPLYEKTLNTSDLRTILEIRKIAEEIREIIATARFKHLNDNALKSIEEIVNTNAINRLPWPLMRRNLLIE